MRPRHKTAENRLVGGEEVHPGRASMRPRHKTAENPFVIEYVRPSLVVLQ